MRAPCAVSFMRATLRRWATQYRNCGHLLIRMPEKLLSLVTFFAAAKKVTAAPHRGELIDREQSKFHRSRSASNGSKNTKPKRQRHACAKKVTAAPHRGELIDH